MVLGELAVAHDTSTCRQAAEMADAATPGPQLLLVEDGKALAPIMFFKDEPPFTRQAADELAEYIEKTSGEMLGVMI